MLEETGRVQQRNRLLPAHLVVYFVLVCSDSPEQPAAAPARAYIRRCQGPASSTGAGAICSSRA
ncbi:transposase domain-containing protein [Streptomyces sp. NPDC088846]|uniref:transposase domain-containing protein n=1 Tax=Streptomyces sp. NPDC088846 TaxID=3365908 RepID=UPI003826ADC5